MEIQKFIIINIFVFTQSLYKYNENKYEYSHGTLTESHKKMLFPRDFEEIFGKRKLIK